MELFPVPDNLQRDDYLYLANMANQAKRSFEMTKFVEKLVEKSSLAGADLTSDEVTLLITATNKAIVPLLSSWNEVNKVVLELSSEGEVKLNLLWLATDYLCHVASELKGRCQTFIGLVDDHLLRLASSEEMKVCYLTIKANCHTYMAEVEKEVFRKEEAAKAKAVYIEAQEIAIANLPPSNATRLSVAVGLSKLNSMILDEVDRGYNVAKQAFEEALPEMGSQGGENSTRKLMELLRKSLLKWRPYEQVHALPPRRFS